MFLFSKSAKLVDFISLTISLGYAYSYQNLSPFLILLNWNAFSLIPIYPNTAPSTNFSPNIAKYKSVLDNCWYIFCSNYAFSSF